MINMWFYWMTYYGTRIIDRTRMALIQGNTDRDGFVWGDPESSDRSLYW